MNNTTGKFLSCDWGTSSFRLRVVEIAELKIIADKESNMGIAVIFNRWQEHKEQNRLSFYLDIVRHHIDQIEQSLQISLQNVPLIISGMASSSLGMMELDYKALPFMPDGSDLNIKRISAPKNFQHDIYLISGVMNDHDVMRGEETQLIGCLTSLVGDQIIILPGTHSKHVFFKDGKIVDFKTYMTGEFFELLSRKSILSSSVQDDGNFEIHKNQLSFEKGLLDSQHSNLLNSAFHIRTNSLFKRLALQENYYYLSGLLIGEELKDLNNSSIRSIILIVNRLLEPIYKHAIEYLFPSRQLKIENVDRAIVYGQFKVYEFINLRHNFSDMNSK